jgi:hypothetical protein
MSVTRDTRRNKVRRGYTYQIIKLYSGDALVHARDDLLGDGSSIDVIRVEAITQPGNTSCDLIELDTLLASIWSKMSSGLVE